MFRYFESAEIELLRKVGITYDLRRYYAFPRVHVECDFMGAIAHDDLIEIEAALTRSDDLRHIFNSLRSKRRRWLQKGR